MIWRENRESYLVFCASRFTRYASRTTINQKGILHGFAKKKLNRPEIAAAVLLLLLIGLAGIAHATKADQGNSLPASTPAFLQKLTADKRNWIRASGARMKEPVWALLSADAWPV